MWPLSWLSSAHRRIWPRPKEDADSTVLLRPGVTGRQAQWVGLTCESHDLNAWGLGWLQKGPLLLTQSALSLTHSPEPVPRRMGSSGRVCHLCPGHKSAPRGKASKAQFLQLSTREPGLSTYTHHKIHMEKDIHTELSLGRHRHIDP